MKTGRKTRGQASADPFPDRQEDRIHGNPGPQTTEQAIMAAAEELFLEKGYDRATTVMIAGKAGVTHAMLHYYFRTKEHIFMKVLEKILEELMQSFRPVMLREGAFWDTLEKGISTHFDFLASHPRFAFFLYDTVVHNPELIDRMKEKFMPVIMKILAFHIGRIREESEKGSIRSVDPVQLVMDIATLNLSTFLLLPVAAGFSSGMADAGWMREFLDIRKAEIIALIKSRLYGDI